MAFTGTFTATPVADVAEGDIIQLGTDVAIVEHARAVELDDSGVAVVYLIVRRWSRARARTLVLDADYVLLVQDVTDQDDPPPDLDAFRRLSIPPVDESGYAR